MYYDYVKLKLTALPGKLSERVAISQLIVNVIQSNGGNA
jgi:hypothetical protein